MSSARVYVVFSVSLLILISAFVIMCGAQVGTSEAASAISRGDKAVEAAFGSLKAAEEAGGNVTELARGLNVALDDLSDARSALQAGRYDEAVLSAEKAVNDSNVVSAEAVSLKSAAEDKAKVEFRNQVILSAALVVLIVVLGYMGWRRFKERYLRTIETLRPEVTADEP